MLRYGKTGLNVFSKCMAPNSLLFSKRQNFRPVQIEKIYRRKKNHVAEKLKFDSVGRVENIVGKGENAGYQHFLLFAQCFRKASFSGSLKVEIVWEMVN